jgi:hypothetical protein
MSRESEIEERKSYSNGEFIGQQILKGVLSHFYKSKERAQVELNEICFQLNWTNADEWRTIKGKIALFNIECRCH